MTKVSPTSPGYRSLGHRINYWLQLIIRLVLAYSFIEYGVAKLLGTQFIQTGSALDKSVSELSGFELTWIYFGYSPLLSGVIAWGQIACAALLLFDRTKRLGMLGLFPITVNIVLVNFGYNISRDTKFLSCVFLGLNSYLILSDFPAIKQFLWDHAFEESHRPSLIGRYSRISLGIRVLFLVVAVGVGYSLISYLKNSYMSETVLTGDWTIQEVRLGGKTAEISNFPMAGWDKVNFEFMGSITIHVATGVHSGKYEIIDGSKVHIRYNPQARGRKLSEEDRRKIEEFMRQIESMSDEELLRISEAEMEKSLTAHLKGTFDLTSDRKRLVIRGDHSGQPFEIILVPWIWEKR